MVPSTTSPVVNLSQNPSQEQIVYENKYEDYLALAEADLEALDERIAIMQESGVPAQVAIDTCKYRAWHVTIDGVEYSRVTRPMSLAEFKASYPDVQSFRAYAVGVFQIDCSDDSSAPSTLVSL